MPAMVQETAAVVELRAITANKCPVSLHWGPLMAYLACCPGHPSPRLQVEKHVEKLQKEKEAKAMEKLQVLVPNVGPAVLALALEECAHDVDHAVVMLRRFQVAKGKELSTIHKVRRSCPTTP